MPRSAPYVKALRSRVSKRSDGGNAASMSLRDQFAIEAMTDALHVNYSDETGTYLDAARRAYEFADAMLIARAA